MRQFMTFSLSFALLLPSALSLPHSAVAAVPLVPAVQQETATDSAAPSKAEKHSAVKSSRLHHPVLWRQRDDIRSLDLLHGQGGEKHMPAPPFLFVDEDLNGTNPKFDVRDAEGREWRCKLGDEARPEVVASRLLWAVGYFGNDDYLLPAAEVRGLHLKRGENLVKSDSVSDVRFARKPDGQTKIGIWEWKSNPFYGSQAFNGLRVMMAVLNNWDLKDVNNAVYQDSKTGEQIFLVSDVGATFGSNGLGFSKARSKGNIGSFKGSKFVDKVHDNKVDFATPKAPTSVLLLSGGTTAKSFHMRTGLNWIGDDIPIQDARWIGSLLGQLSHQQLVDAFRAGNFPDEAITDYVSVVEGRIDELKKL